jgi:hypothetical protein
MGLPMHFGKLRGLASTSLSQFLNLAKNLLVYVS